YNNRYLNPRVDRYGNQIVRTKDPILPIPTPVAHKPKIQQSTESAWERGLKQARELISRASKRKEEEEDFDNKRYNLTEKSQEPYDEQEPTGSPTLPLPPPSSSLLGNVPLKRRRHSHSSSEDEMERRHRLAYDAAPWNNPRELGSSGPPYSSSSSSNYRSRSNYYSSQYSRSGDSYRDPWRRSKSPQSRQIPYNRNRDVPADSRYGETLYNKKVSAENRSESMSSLSSICSSSSESSHSSRKLPYSRPSSDSRSRFVDNGLYYLKILFINYFKKIIEFIIDTNQSYIETYSEHSNKSKGFTRIPKKTNASSAVIKNDDGDEDHHSIKSFDSWSESLSDSDSYYSISDSDASDHRQTKDSKHKRSSARFSGSSNKTLRNTGETKSHHHHHNETSKNSKSDHAVVKETTNVRKSKAEMAGKVPIKMTFMKKQQSLKQDTIINEQLNGGNVSDIDENSSLSRISQKSMQSNRSSDYVMMEGDHGELLDNDDNTTFSVKSSEKEPSSTVKHHRREELLMKLKAVEEAIERKLSSKN
ncbi:hypothetical protein BLA29_002956, partial [Euroglyphus maynei]